MSCSAVSNIRSQPRIPARIPERVCADALCPVRYCLPVFTGGTECCVASEKFFAALWKANAVIIFLAGLVAAAAGVGALGLILAEAFRTRHVQDVAFVEKGQGVSESTRLGDFRAIDGTDVLRAELYLDQGYDGGFGSGKQALSTRNYLFFDPESRTTRWLRPEPSGLILSTENIPEAGYVDPKPAPQAFLYVVAESDSNGDRRISQKDDKAIALSRPTGEQYKVVLPHVDGFEGAALLKNGNGLILYSLRSDIRAAEVELATFTVVDDRQLIARPQ